MGFQKINLDLVHESFTDTLKAHRIWYQDCAKFGDGITDLICAKTSDKTVFVEAKTSMMKSITKAQLEFIASTKSFVGIAFTPDELLQLCSEPEKYSFSQKDKDLIQVWLDTKGAYYFAEMRQGKNKRIQLMQLYVDILKRPNLAKTKRDKNSINTKIKNQLENKRPVR